MIRISLCFWVVLCAIGIFTVQRNPAYVFEEKRRQRAELMMKQQQEQEKAQLLGSGLNHTEKTMVSEHEEERDFLTFSEGIRHPRFYHLTLMQFFGIFYGIYMAAVYK